MEAVRSQIHVLLVENEDSIRPVFKRLLEQGGHEVAIAGSLAEARGVMSAGCVDVLITDIDLPDGDGRALLRELRAIHPAGGIVVSGHCRKIDMDQSIKMGFNVHINKPFRIEQVMDAVRQYCPTVHQRN